MFWEEEEDKTLPYQAPDDVIDLSFSMQCKELPIDHAWALSQAIVKELPWMETEKFAGVHQIHVAESGNGWERPENPEEETLKPSHRTKLVLRIPKTRIKDAETLVGKTISIAGYPLTIKKPRKKTLVNSSVIFARYVLSSDDEDENSFLMRMADEIKSITGEKVKKMMCGKTYKIKTPDGDLLTRHLMIAEQSNDSSIQLQQYGLGEGRILGCGIFMPHKGIRSLKPTE